jgi:hypothetical protein
MTQYLDSRLSALVSTAVAELAASVQFVYNALMIKQV